MSSAGRITWHAADRRLAFPADAPRLILRPLEAMLDGWRLQGDVVRFRVGPRHAYLVAHPDDVRRVLHERRDGYVRDARHAACLREVSGNGLTGSDGELWRRQRLLLRPAFQRDRLDAFAAATARATGRLVERWSDAARAGRPVELHPELLRVSLDALAEALFGVELGGRTPTIVHDAAVALGRLSIAMRLPLPGARAILLRRSRSFQAARRRLYRLADTLLERRATAPEGADLLSLLARQPDRVLARDQVITMILAGHDTTGAALTWACLLAATHPDVEQRLHEEAVERLGPAGTPFDPAAARGAAYAAAVVSEALRLYPPAWVLSRTPTEPDTIGGHVIPPGATVFVSPYVTHRHPSFWREPERFDPDRFHNATRPANPYAYLPFGAGPRMCVGKTLAETVGQVVLAVIVRSFRIVPGDAEAWSPAARLTLQPNSPVEARLEPR